MGEACVVGLGEGDNVGPLGLLALVHGDARSPDLQRVDHQRHLPEIVYPRRQPGGRPVPDVLLELPLVGGRNHVPVFCGTLVVEIY